MGCTCLDKDNCASTVLPRIRHSQLLLSSTSYHSLYHEKQRPWRLASNMPAHGQGYLTKQDSLEDQDFFSFFLKRPCARAKGTDQVRVSEISRELLGGYKVSERSCRLNIVLSHIVYDTSQTCAVLVFKYPYALKLKRKLTVNWAGQGSRCSGLVMERTLRGCENVAAGIVCSRPNRISLATCRRSRVSEPLSSLYSTAAHSPRLATCRLRMNCIQAMRS